MSIQLTATLQENGKKVELSFKGQGQESSKVVLERDGKVLGAIKKFFTFDVEIKAGGQTVYVPASSIKKWIQTNQLTETQGGEWKNHVVNSLLTSNHYGDALIAHLKLMNKPNIEFKHFLQDTPIHVYERIVNMVKWLKGHGSQYEKFAELFDAAVSQSIGLKVPEEGQTALGRLAASYIANPTGTLSKNALHDVLEIFTRNPSETSHQKTLDEYAAQLKQKKGVGTTLLPLITQVMRGRESKKANDATVIQALLNHVAQNGDFADNVSKNLTYLLNKANET